MFFVVMLGLLLDHSVEAEGQEYTYLIKYLNETAIRDIQITETLEQDIGLSKPSFLLLSPLQTVANMLIKSNYRKAHVKHLKKFWPELELTKTHKERIGHFLDSCLFMHSETKVIDAYTVLCNHVVSSPKSLFENLFFLLIQYKNNLK